MQASQLAVVSEAINRRASVIHTMTESLGCGEEQSGTLVLMASLSHSR